MKNFVDEPHAAIEGPGQGEIVNLTDHRAADSRSMQLEVLTSLGPDGISRELTLLEQATSAFEGRPGLPHLNLPSHHDVRASDIVGKRLYGNPSQRRLIGGQPTSLNCC